MQKHLVWLIAAGLAGGTLVACDETEDVAIAPAAESSPAATEAKTHGERVGDVGEIVPDSIYEVLAETTEAAMTVNGFDDLVERLAADDKGRFAGIADQDLQAVEAPAKALRDAWQAKYNGEMDINDPAAVFRPLVDIQPGPRTGDKVMATVNFKEGDGLPAFSINMVKDVTWHIDVPDSYDRESLREALIIQLSKISNSPEAWPPNTIDAQRRVAHHVMAALANTGVSGATKRETPGGLPPK